MKLTVGIYIWNGDANPKVGEIVWDGEKFTQSGTLTSI